MAPKKTILVIEDELDSHALIEMHFRKFFPQDQYELAIASDFMQAAEVLCDKDRIIAGVIADNGFALSAGSERKGAAYKVQRDDYGEVMNHLREGSAGSMLIRFMRTGHAQAQSQESQEALTDLEPRVRQWLGDGYNQRIEELKAVPVVWNSAHPALGKVHEVSIAASGGLIDPEDPRVRDESSGVSGNEMVEVGEHTWCSNKDSFKKMFELLSRVADPTAERTSPSYTTRHLNRVSTTPTRSH